MPLQDTAYRHRPAAYIPVDCLDQASTFARISEGGPGDVNAMKPVNMVSTATELLDGLHDSGNQEAWQEFDRRYRPILFGFLRRMGLNEPDAADVAQETLTCFVKDYRLQRYDRGQGRLRSWLIGIARCRLVDQRRAAHRRRELRGESALMILPSDADADAIWQAEERRVIFQSAICELRKATRFQNRTIEAFERVVLHREPVDSVAGELGMTAQEIYNAKNRVIERLREIVKRYEDQLVGE